MPPSGGLVGSDFLQNNEGWSIIGNKEASSPAIFEPYSRGPSLNRYVYGTDDKINRPGQSSASATGDLSLWYFNAPPDFLGNNGIAYGGTLQFTLAAFSGDFNSLNDANVRVFVYMFTFVHVEFCTYKHSRDVLNVFSLRFYLRYLHLCGLTILIISPDPLGSSHPIDMRPMRWASRTRHHTYTSYKISLPSIHRLCHQLCC